MVEVSSSIALTLTFAASSWGRLAEKLGYPPDTNLLMIRYVIVARPT